MDAKARRPTGSREPEIEPREPAAKPAPSMPAMVLALQRSAGNAAVASAIRAGTLPDAPARRLSRQIVAGPGGAPPSVVAQVPEPTGNGAQNLAAATAFHNGPPLGPQAIQSSTGIGGFSATYVPATDTLTITLNAAVDFRDGISDENGTLVAEDPQLEPVIANVPQNEPDRSLFLSTYRWTDTEKQPWLADLVRIVKAAWRGKHEFHVARPQWKWVGARVRIAIRALAQPRDTRLGDDHFAITTLKMPANPTFRSSVGGDRDRTNAFDGTMTLSSQDVGPRYVGGEQQRESLDFEPGSARIGGLRQRIADFGSLWRGPQGSRPATIAIIARADRRHRDLARRRALAVKRVLQGAGIRRLSVRVVTGGNAQRVDMIGGDGQFTVAHEFGHAFGLGDQYVEEGRPGQAAGDPAAHSGVTQAMTDAHGHHLPGAVVADNNDIMSRGNRVRAQHYSTFHEALRAITGIEEWALGAKSARPRARRRGRKPARGRRS